MTILKKSAAILLIMVFTLSLFSACSKKSGTQAVALFAVDEHLSEAILHPSTTSGSLSTPGEDPDDPSAFVPETVGDSTQTQESGEEPTAAEGETTSAPAKQTVTGVGGGTTSKGFAITVKDGITYVDGVMIANKTYSLPESYYPGDLTSDTSAAFYEMQAAAAADGADLYIASGFRSYSLQNDLYNRYVSQDGQEAADRYSARPGHSEHQTGYAIDLNDISYSFADTTEGKWVAANCYKYGFILRYPEDKEAQTGYRYEPWHIRYVGVDTATKVYNSGLCLEEYFGITSEYQ